MQLPKASPRTGRKVFSLVIPPPNVTGVLHMGHMLEHAEIDVAIRWHQGCDLSADPDAEKAGISRLVCRPTDGREPAINCARRELT